MEEEEKSELMNETDPGNHLLFKNDFSHINFL